MFREFLFLLVAATSVFAQAANYTYDSGGHLVKANYGGAVVTYTYDPAGHLISRVTARTRCDVTGDGQVSIADVQAVINMALGLIASTTAADFNGDGVLNVVDVEIIVTVVLGTATCPN
jgi:hypothetical protein